MQSLHGRLGSNAVPGEWRLGYVGREQVQALRVGLVGAGLIGHQHALAWQANAPRGAIVAVADVAPDRARHLIAQLGDDCVAAYPDLETMLAESDLDAIDICLPHDLHTAAILAAAEAGKAMLCEKPMCTTLADAALIRGALQASGVPFVMGHNQLFQPSLIEARRMLAAGVIGRPFVIRSIEAMHNRSLANGHVSTPIGEGESPWAWRADPRRAGGGELLDTGWHATYRLLALAADRPVEVAAMTERFAIDRMACEDTGVVSVRFASGIIGEILTSWAFGLVGDWHFEVAAAHGSLAGGRTRLLHQIHGWAEPAERVNAPVHTFTAEIAHFLDVVQCGEPALAAFDDAARVLQLTMAAYEAAATRQVMALPEDPTDPARPA
jgi:predicted dehydrogenase